MEEAGQSHEPFYLLRQSILQSDQNNLNLYIMFQSTKQNEERNRYLLIEKILLFLFDGYKTYSKETERQYHQAASTSSVAL